MTDEIIEALEMSPLESKSVYVVMTRVGADNWYAWQTCESLEDAQQACLADFNCTAKRIVLVSNLPIEVSEDIV